MVRSPDARTQPIDWLDEALSLEDQLLRQARRTPGGEVAWQDPRSARSTDARPARLGPDLYEGVIGVAVFLAALEHVDGAGKRGSFIEAALAPLRRQFKNLVRNREARVGLGGFRGLGGFLYGFLLIGRWHGEPALIKEAAGLATLVTRDSIGADDALDLMNGCAGAMLGLLALDRVRAQPAQGQTPIERAVACGERLLERRASVGGGPRAWPVQGRPPRCGFAHGAAGIAYSLARLFERTGDRRFLEAAEEGAAFERLHFPAPGSMASWCNGAPGIALGRLGMLGLSAAAPVRQDLDAALETTLAFSRPAGDGLCCGNLGRAEILLHASQILGDDRLSRAAEDVAGRAVECSRGQDGAYRWAAPGDGRFSPSFFQGAAGIGYVLLRLARPSQLPCVLALEAA